MFITPACVLFLIKLRWPRNKSLHDMVFISFLINLEIQDGGPRWPPHKNDFMWRFSEAEAYPCIRPAPLKFELTNQR